MTANVRFAPSLTFLVLLSAGIILGPRQARADEVDAKIAELERQIQVVTDEMQRVLAELQEGMFCSRCDRSKTEIERSEPFERHLENVSGEPVPASAAVIARKRRYYQDKIASLRAEIERLRSRRAREQEAEQRRQQEDSQRRSEQSGGGAPDPEAGTGDRSEKSEEFQRLLRQLDREKAHDLAMERSRREAGMPYDQWVMRHGTPEQKQAMARETMGRSIGNLLGTVLRGFESTRRERESEERRIEAEAKAEELARRQRVRERQAAWERERERAALAERQREDTARRRALEVNRNDLGDVFDRMNWSGPSNVVERAPGEMARGTMMRLLLGENDVGRAVKAESRRSGMALYFSVNDAALELMPPETQTRMRIVQVMQAWSTMRVRAIWGAYDNLMRKDIFQQMERITTEAKNDP